MSASAVPTEQVLVVPTSIFHQIGHFQGFCDQVDKYVDPLLNSELVRYEPRDRMEEDPNFKQLIPYVIFLYKDAEDVSHVFQYTRGSGQGESRLHAKLSIGIGGHISVEDTNSNDTSSEANSPYFVGMQRELDEEVRIDTAYDDQCVGLINDDETEVGKVHLGVVHIFRVAEPKVEANETDIVDAGFVPVSQLRENLDRMETWSSYCFKSLFGE